MEKYIFDQCNGLWYEFQGNYYVPCLVLDEAGTSPIGMWGRKHQQYLEEHRPMLYSDLVLSGKLYSCYEMTFFNRKSQRTFTCQIVQNAKRHLKGAKTMQISGIGHSVIRGLGTTGQWFSASTTVYPRGSPQGRRHSYFVDC